MKLIIGKNPNADGGFKILGKSGADITDEISVKTATIIARAGEMTSIHLEAYGEAEIEGDTVEIEVKLLP